MCVVCTVYPAPAAATTIRRIEKRNNRMSVSLKVEDEENPR